MSKEYLETLIEMLKSHFNYRAISVWNLDGKCQFATDVYCGYLNIQNVYGKEMGELHEDLRLCQDEFRSKVTQKVLTNKKPVLAYFMNRSRDGNNYQIYQVVSSPLIRNNEVVGFMSDIQLIDNASVYNHLLGALSLDNNQGFHETETKLTRREHIILFLLMIGKGHKEIAIILSELFGREILPNSVSSIISKQIYNKFAVYNNSSLIKAAFRKGVLYNIPPELASKFPRIVIITEEANFENLSSTLTYL